jgi:hypothetical protein
MKKPKGPAKAVPKGKPSAPRKAKKSNKTKIAKVTKIPRLDGKPGKPNDISWHERFLVALKADRCVTNACRVAGTSRNVAFEHRTKFPEFAKAWDEARMEHADAIEGAFIGRVLKGVISKKFTGAGDPIMDPATKQQYCEVDFNETAVLRALAALKPEVWSEKRRLELSGKITMTDDEIAEASTKTEESLLLTLAGGLKGKRTD